MAPNIAKFRRAHYYLRYCGSIIRPMRLRLLRPARNDTGVPGFLTRKRLRKWSSIQFALIAGWFCDLFYAPCLPTEFWGIMALSRQLNRTRFSIVVIKYAFQTFNACKMLQNNNVPVKWEYLIPCGGSCGISLEALIWDKNDHPKA